MSEQQEERTDRGPWWVIAAGSIGAVTLTIVYVRFRTGFPVGTLEAHAALGSALAPAVAFLTLMAVIAALWSVQIQRTELALQRQELQETRKEMVEQRKQFERTAKAQEALAASQVRLADAQETANVMAVAAMIAQRDGLIVGIATAEASIAGQSSGLAVGHSSNHADAFNQRMKATSDRLQALAKLQGEEITQLRKVALHVKKEQNA